MMPPKTQYVAHLLDGPWHQRLFVEPSPETATRATLCEKSVHWRYVSTEGRPTHGSATFCPECEEAASEAALPTASGG